MCILYAKFLVGYQQPNVPMGWLVHAAIYLTTVRNNFIVQLLTTIVFIFMCSCTHLRYNTYLMDTQAVSRYFLYNYIFVAYSNV